MKYYVVGGAVRDGLLGLKIQDRDWVVVGSTPQAMLDAGFKPVGKDFPVFLHPLTHEEYALARTERKSAPGYHGFSFYAAPDVTLEQDLSRRDFTINAMAQAENGEITDVYSGRADLQQKILRHVSPAFSEDPVRILRAARFMARFTDFSLAPETLQLMQQMVQQGEVDALVPERVWQEIARGLMYAQPKRMFDLLNESGALPRVMGISSHDVDSKIISVFIFNSLALQSAAELNFAQRFAWLCDGIQAVNIKALCAQWRVPNEISEMALLWNATHAKLFEANTAGVETLKVETSKPETLMLDTVEIENQLNLLERCDALRKPLRFQMLLSLAHFAAQQKKQKFNPTIWMRALEKVQAVDGGAVAAQAKLDNQAQQIPQKIRAARLAALAIM